ncbi:MAG: hypothetical protein ABEI86_03310, partial [Halobacteriaceae archaeon]
KQIVQQCERLMDNPEQIRNIAIAAHIDHGKCVSAETKVSLADGTVVSAGELFSQIEATGEQADDYKGDAYIPTEDIEVASFDR